MYESKFSFSAIVNRFATSKNIFFQYGNVDLPRNYIATIQKPVLQQVIASQSLLLLLNTTVDFPPRTN